jgi:hypothetical protein
VLRDLRAGYAAADLAYGDVARAFDHFLSVNPSGPFILASHSEGSIHALRLLQERIIGTPLHRRLVVAYVIGLALPAQIAEAGLPVCGIARRCEDQPVFSRDIRCATSSRFTPPNFV